MIGNLIGWAVFGLIAGAIARLLVPGKQSMGIIMTMILGIVGSMVGGFVWALLFNGGNYAGGANWIGSILGGVLVLVIFCWATRSRRTV